MDALLCDGDGDELAFHKAVAAGDVSLVGNLLDAAGAASPGGEDDLLSLGFGIGATPL